MLDIINIKYELNNLDSLNYLDILEEWLSTKIEFPFILKNLNKII